METKFDVLIVKIIAVETNNAIFISNQEEMVPVYGRDDQTIVPQEVTTEGRRG